MGNVSLTVNGVLHELELEPRELLVYVLRERLGLTGTTVGCDTSSCGACTVLLDGESVKSCTVLGVQANGHELTTIEGPGDERLAAPAAGELPRPSRAPVRLLHVGDDPRGREPAAENPRPERGRDPARARGEHLPLHRLPEHRRRDRGGGGMSAQVATGNVIGAAVERKEDLKLLQGQAQWVDNMRLPGMVYLAIVRSPYAHARIKKRRRRACARARGRRSRRGPARISPRSGTAACRARGCRPRTRRRRCTCRSRRTRRATPATASRSSSRRAAPPRRTPPSSCRSTTSRCRP